MKEYIIQENMLYNTSEGWFLSGLKKDNLLIRCKDCKYFNEKYSWCDCYLLMHLDMSEDDYCSRAERKEK